VSQSNKQNTDKHTNKQMRLNFSKFETIPNIGRVKIITIFINKELFKRHHFLNCKWVCTLRQTGIINTVL